MCKSSSLRQFKWNWLKKRRQYNHPVVIFFCDTWKCQLRTSSHFYWLADIRWQNTFRVCSNFEVIVRILVFGICWNNAYFSFDCLVVKFKLRTFYIFTSPRNRGGVIFSLQFVCMSVCLCVCLSVCVSGSFLWTKFQPNRYTDLDAVFAKHLHSTLARTLLKLVTFGQKWRSQWLFFFFIILC